MILHVDMDAFYASVEEREQPDLVGKPVIVGGNAESRGVVAAANYEARKYGIHSAMASAVARRLCPRAVFIRPRLDYYSSVSRQIREILERYTPLIEPLSLDEAFLDVTDSERLFGPATSVAETIKGDIVRELELVASVGVASNKFIAKLASDLEKPDGIVVVEPGTEQDFLDPLPVGCLWGVGRASGEAFKAMGVGTIGELRLQPLAGLQARFGRHGEHLWNLAHGIDARAVVPDHRAKSISHETTFARDVDDLQILLDWLRGLTEQVTRRLRRLDLRARTVQIKVRFADFRTITRSHSLAQATALTQETWRVAARLLKASVRGRPVRLIGVGVSGFEASGPVQQGLFDTGRREKQGRIDSVVDEVKDRFGEAALGRGKKSR